MPTPRRSRSTQSQRTDLFEENVTATLESQDRLLERLDQKLEHSPALNGGFESLVKKVDKIESVTERLHEGHVATSKQVTEIHVVVLDPETGLYHKVKAHSSWIETASKSMKWISGLLIAGTLTGVGKLLYDFISSHIHLTP